MQRDGWGWDKCLSRATLYSVRCECNSVVHMMTKVCLMFDKEAHDMVRTYGQHRCSVAAFTRPRDADLSLLRRHPAGDIKS